MKIGDYVVVKDPKIASNHGYSSSTIYRLATDGSDEVRLGSIGSSNYGSSIFRMNVSRLTKTTMMKMVSALAERHCNNETRIGALLENVGSLSDDHKIDTDAIRDLIENEEYVTEKDILLSVGMSMVNAELVDEYNKLWSNL